MGKKLFFNTSYFDINTWKNTLNSTWIYQMYKYPKIPNYGMNKSDMI